MEIDFFQYSLTYTFWRMYFKSLFNFRRQNQQGVWILFHSKYTANILLKLTYTS